MKFEVDIDLTPEDLAKAFCDLSDEEQADFFVHAAKHAEQWPYPAQHQWMAVGRHLLTCDCSTQGARDMVRDIVEGLNDDE